MIVSSARPAVSEVPSAQYQVEEMAFAGGIDGPDTGPRGAFNKVRAMINHLGAAVQNEPTTQRFVVDFLTEIERAVLGFCRERVPDIDMPSQKLVFLAPA